MELKQLLIVTISFVFVTPLIELSRLLSGEKNWFLMMHCLSKLIGFQGNLKSFGDMEILENWPNRSIAQMEG